MIKVVGGNEAVLGLNIFCAIIDDANFLGKDRPVKKPKKPAMLIIAEMACGPREVRKILTKHAEDLLENKTSFSTPTRKWLENKLYEFCAQHYYGDFQRKKTVEAVAKRTLNRWFYARYDALYTNKTEVAHGCQE